jgi:hypothetical protein
MLPRLLSKALLAAGAHPSPPTARNPVRDGPSGSSCSNSRAKSRTSKYPRGAGHEVLRLGPPRRLVDAVEIESNAKRRLADEHDAAQEPGESIRATSTLESLSSVVRMEIRRASRALSAIASMAFVAKFSTTCSRWTGSALTSNGS